MSSFPVYAFLLAIFIAVAYSTPLKHDWTNALQGQFIDFGYSCSEPGCVGITPFTPERAAAVASKYSIISLEKCTGAKDTEAAIWASAALLKQYNPKLKVFFYLATDLGGFQCYASLPYYLSRPDFWLRDDAGAVVNVSNTQLPMLDYANPEATAWWASIPLDGERHADVIDGVLADGSGSPCPIKNVSDARCAALAAGKAGMIAALQAHFDNTNQGVVLQNLISMYGNLPDDGMSWIKYSDGVMGEHYAVFEDILADGSLNVTRVVDYLGHIATAAAAGKTVVMGTWPGPCTTPFAKDGYPSWPGGTQPNTTAGWRQALLDNHDFALAGYLTVAEETVYMQYMGWCVFFLCAQCLAATLLLTALPLSVFTPQVRWLSPRGCPVPLQPRRVRRSRFDDVVSESLQAPRRAPRPRDAHRQHLHAPL